MWAPDQWKVNKGKIVIRRSQSSTIDEYSEYKTVLDSRSHFMDSGFRVLDSSLFQWNLDPVDFIIAGYLSSILDSKALDSGFHIKIFPDCGSYKQKFSRFWNPDTLTWGEVQVKHFRTVDAYLIKQWEIYFSSNFRFYNMMNRSNLWSMQDFQTGPHFK